MADSMTKFSLEPILTYEMDETQAKAYKLALIWMTLAEQEFPNNSIMRLRRKGDPRKSTLFKYCYKLIQETKGLIEDADYKLYILAQLHIFKAFKVDGAYIDPHILVGRKAWRRWLVWQNRFNKKMTHSHATINEFDFATNAVQITSELDKTKQFFIKKFGNMPTEEQITRGLESKILIDWIALDKVSPYYALLSPYFKRALSEAAVDFPLDLEVYRKYVSLEIEKYFEQTFPLEFNKC